MKDPLRDRSFRLRRTRATTGCFLLCLDELLQHGGFLQDRRATITNPTEDDFMTAFKEYSKSYIQDYIDHELALKLWRHLDYGPGTQLRGDHN